MTFWRSTKLDPPPRDQVVFARWWRERKKRWGWVEMANPDPETFPSWAPMLDPNDGTTPEDWT